MPPLLPAAAEAATRLGLDTWLFAQLRRSRVVVDAKQPPPQRQQQQQQQERLGVLLAVGPEGGWIPPEMETLQHRLRCVPFRLIDKVLKCEAALMACLTQLTLFYEDPMMVPMLRVPGEVYAAAAQVTLAAAPPNDETAPLSDGVHGDAQRWPGGREIVRRPGGFLMTFPQRYITRKHASP